MKPPDPWVCFSFLLAAFLAAGVAQVLWLRCSWSARFAAPLDGGRTLRGRRLFGENKTLRGFVVMVPAVGLAFALLGGVRGPWSLSISEYLLLGCWVGLGFMAGELPNSFVKRQLDIRPGGAPAHPLGRAIVFAVDRVDSLLGGLAALSLIVPVPIVVWATVLVLGAGVHWLFNVVLVLVGVKRRAA